MGGENNIYGGKWWNSGIHAGYLGWYSVKCRCGGASIAVVAAGVARATVTVGAQINNFQHQQHYCNFRDEGGAGQWQTIQLSKKYNDHRRKSTINHQFVSLGEQKYGVDWSISRDYQIVGWSAGGSIALVL